MRPESAIHAAAIVLLAITIAFTFRYSAGPATPLAGAYLLDRWTGQLRFCALDVGTANRVLKCE